MTTLLKGNVDLRRGIILYEAIYGSTNIVHASTEDETKSVQLVSEFQTALTPKRSTKTI